MFLVSQTWLRCLASSLDALFFFPNVKAIVTAVSLRIFGNIERSKMWNRQMRMVGLAKVTCKRSGNTFPLLLSRKSSFEHCRCFGSATKGADGAADLLEVLRNSPLEKLQFDCCSQIPSTAWQKLRGASWTNLRDANFSMFLVSQTWLRCLASSLDALFFFPMLRPLSRLFLWEYLATLKGQKCEIDRCIWSDLQKSLARGAATDCRPFIPTVLFWSFQVLWQLHQRCWWGRRPAGSLAELFPGEVAIYWLRSNSVHCVAASSQWRMARAAWCTRHPREGVAPHPWRRRLEAASGVLGGCAGGGVGRGRFAVHNLCMFAFIWS